MRERHIERLNASAHVRNVGSASRCDSAVRESASARPSSMLAVCARECMSESRSTSHRIVRNARTLGGLGLLTQSLAGLLQARHHLLDILNRSNASSFA